MLRPPLLDGAAVPVITNNQWAHIPESWCQNMHRAVASGATKNGNAAAVNVARSSLMIDYISLEHVGPSAKMALQFGPRLNLLTGDNGLGKTFVLDIAWWALTRTWAGPPAMPRWGDKGKPTIEYCLWGKSKKTDVLVGKYDRQTQSWKPPQGRPPMPGLVIYVRIDGGFSVWDPARNYWKKLAAREFEHPDRPSAFQFTQDQVWKGLQTGEGNGETVLCNGLLRDWILWQFQKKDLFKVLTEVLAGLSPHQDEVLRPGEPVRSSVVDVRDEPTLELPYGTVPVTVASAGMRRMLALAYLLVWTWSEHKAASALLHQPTTDRLVLLIDEVEAHLHPQWQRVLLPAVLDVIGKLYSDIFKREVQILATTHAPLVLASVESRFNTDLDRLITFVPRKRERDVAVRTEEWSKQGDVLGWLVSDAFGLKQARSREAERAIEAAEAFMRQDMAALPKDLRTREQIHKELLRVLPGHDSFWPRWIVAGEETGR